MKIDIWSDIMCPFCYIGKRKLEGAMQQFAGKDKLEIEWHSFQLDPDAQPQPGKDMYDYLAERKGQSRAWSIQAHQHVTQMAAEAGLTYNFDKAVIANSFDAHRLIQLAKKYKKDDTAEERIFRAYFTEGADIADKNTLLKLALEIGLPEQEVKETLNSQAFAEAVEADVARAAAIGVRGVPFFVFDNKYAVSGAQPEQVFLQALEQSFSEWKASQKLFTIVEGDVCGPDGNC